MSECSLKSIFIENNVTSYKQIIHPNTISGEVYEVLIDNVSYILKIPFSLGKWQREHYYLDYLYKKYYVPRIIRALEPKDNKPGYILMNKLKGKVKEDNNIDNDEQAYKFGESLAKLHLISVEKYFDITNPDVSKNPIDILENDFKRSMEECYNIIPSDLIKKAETFLDKNRFTDNDCDGPCIVHRDFKPGNILMHKKEIVGVIDFENTINGFTEEDFAHLENLIWFNQPKTKNSFLLGYKNLRSLPNLEILPVIHMTKILGAIGFTVKRNTWRNKHQHIYNINIEQLYKFFSYYG